MALLSLLAVGGILWLAAARWWKPEMPRVETRAYHELRADGRPVIYFRSIGSDSLLTGISLSPKSVDHAPSLNVAPGSLHRIVDINLSHINHRLSQMDSIRKELEYYLDRHNVRDEGFDMVAERVTILVQRRTLLEKWRDALSRVTPSTSLSLRRVAQSLPADSVETSAVFLAIDNGLWTDGRWVRAMRHGVGVAYDWSGRLVAGRWNTDTMQTGVRFSPEATYNGQTDRWMQAQGHGSCRYGGHIYEGRFVDDRESGFGVAISTHKLRAGEWKDGKFRGERMQYTSERIYGIDISRYQHGKGRKYYPILWSKLRITNLGKNNRNVSGTADYPVSFIYIKSTEGTTVRNKYFLADYRASRRHGYHTGAYHFFSTRTSGALQARFFLRHTRISKGDMPPVLDVEPTDAQIRKMGGPEVMFRNIRQWLTAVGNATGIRPVLYVSQSFVNRYLELAPDIKNGYNVWIARYGEFKPDIKLAYWQLTPHGRVNGIHGEVDINVFNGYRSQFNDFLKGDN